MSTSSEVEVKAKGNQQATSSLVLGILSLLFALGNFAPGAFSFIGCLNPIAALLALVAGILGIRAASKLDGQGRGKALIGIVLSVVGILVFVFALIVPSMIAGQKQADIWANQAVSTSQPMQVFKGDGFTLTYPNQWKELDTQTLGDACKKPETECLAVLTSPAPDAITINMLRFALPDGVTTVDEFDQASWAQTEASPPDGIKLEPKESIKVGDIPAIKRIFSQPSKQDAKERSQYMQIFFVKDAKVYLFTAAAGKLETFTLHRADLDAIIASFKFVP